MDELVPWNGYLEDISMILLGVCFLHFNSILNTKEVIFDVNLLSYHVAYDFWQTILHIKQTL